MNMGDVRCKYAYKAGAALKYKFRNQSPLCAFRQAVNLLSFNGNSCYQSQIKGLIGMLHGL